MTCTPYTGLSHEGAIVELPDRDGQWLIIHRRNFGEFEFDSWLWIECVAKKLDADGKYNPEGEEITFSVIEREWARPVIDRVMREGIEPSAVKVVGQMRKTEKWEPHE